MKLAFMGTPAFAAEILRALTEAGHEIGLVITQPDRRGNRGKVTCSAVKKFALGHGLPLRQPVRLSGDEETKAALQAFDPDLCVVAAYGQILKKDLLDLPRLGCLNVHASLLPDLRGASPIQTAILRGDAFTGVSIMKMAEGLDTGDVISQARIPVDGMNYERLEAALAELGGELLVKTLPAVQAGSCVYTPQDPSRASYAGQIRKQDGRMDFSRSAEELERMIRAFDPWPGAFVPGKKGPLKVWKAEVLPSAGGDLVPGTVSASGPAGIDVACGSGILRIIELQAPGKKRLSAADYLRGRAVAKGEEFGI